MKKKEVKSKKAETKGFSIGCLLGLHAYKNGVCVYCGKKLKK